MSDQWSLFDDPADPGRCPHGVVIGYHCDACEVARIISSRPEWAPVGGVIADGWWAFHGRHPEVLTELITRGRRLVDRGYRHFGIAVLWESMRYETMLGAKPGEEPYKLNNNYRSLYARLLADIDPVFGDSFEFRRLRSLDQPLPVDHPRAV